MITFIITMYDENDEVLESCKNIKKDLLNSRIIIIKSNDDCDSSVLAQLNQYADRLEILPNLGKRIHVYELGSVCITRNISRGFNILYDNYEKESGMIVVMTGDTLITNAAPFLQRHLEMINENKLALVSQAVGQDFHSCNADPINGVFGGRLQTESTTDFACCLFLLDADFCYEHKAFSNIPITNKWTSEQCLGDELSRHLDYKYVKRLNYDKFNTYSYNDGVRYHAKYNMCVRPPELCCWKTLEE